MRFNQMMQFSKLEMKLYLSICDVFGSESNLIGHEYSDGTRAGNVLVGDDSDPVQAIFSFPAKTDDCYLMLSDGDPEELAKEVAALQEYNDTVSHLCRGHTVPTSSKYLNDAGWFFYLITSPKVSHSDLPTELDIEDRPLRIHLALPLTREERDLKVEKGINKLMNKFREANRDPITFNQSHNKRMQSDHQKATPFDGC